MYSDDFLQTFEKSDFFTVCKKSVDGKLQWKEWGECSVSCGGGFQTKIASSCVPYYAVCYDIPILERSCNDQACPIGQWNWNDWSECTASCGGGFRFKTAQSCEPPGAECYELPVLKESCNTMACPDGEWTWNDWGECSDSCGGGIWIRIADQCLPKGALCKEVPVIEETCNEEACPEGYWDQLHLSYYRQCEFWWYGRIRSIYIKNNKSKGLDEYAWKWIILSSHASYIYVQMLLIY